MGSSASSPQNILKVSRIQNGSSIVAVHPLNVKIHAEKVICSLGGDMNRIDLENFFEGNGNLLFFKLFIPFDCPQSLDCLNLSLFGYHTQPRHLLFIFHLENGSKLKRQCFIPPVALTEHAWFSISIGIKSVVRCDIGCKASWGDRNWCFVEGLQFIAESNPELTRNFEEMQSRRDEHAIRGIFLSNHGRKGDVDVSHPGVVRIAREEVSGVFSQHNTLNNFIQMLDGASFLMCSCISLPFCPLYAPRLLRCVHICVFGGDNQPKDIDIIITLSNGTEFKREFRIDRVESPTYAWFSLPLDDLITDSSHSIPSIPPISHVALASEDVSSARVDNNPDMSRVIGDPKPYVICCEICCVSSWAGNPWHRIDGIRIFKGEEEEHAHRQAFERKEKERMLRASKSEFMMKGDRDVLPVLDVMHYKPAKIIKKGLEGSFKEICGPSELIYFLKGKQCLMFYEFTLQFSFPRSICWIELCSGGYESQPKDIDVILHTDDGTTCRSIGVICGPSELIYFLKGKQCLMFYEFTLQFSFPRSICWIELCSGGYESQPKDIDVILHTDDGTTCRSIGVVTETESQTTVSAGGGCGGIGKITKEFRLERMPEKEYQWHKLDISCIDNVTGCTVKCVNSWGGHEWCMLDMIRFIVDNRRDQIERKRRERKQQHERIEIQFEDEYAKIWGE
ncbi:hypothetical protein ADUPG1_009508 [Aduncisulcus paluster]|uniref:Uncharacterized protein n=1 Tax=Aduncisulcus paluster TaxID=2918883 RepID=A0ABQ5KVW6_9EUKA|nr:hypothetical protein ADUPG1_009508 [Aduncisulcus paluster]